MENVQNTAGVLVRSIVFGLLLALCGPAIADSPGPGRPLSVELYFEMKLLYRGRVMLRRVALDQWAGGSLSMRYDPEHGELRLERPRIDPWVFRWYPTRDEVKLGAAIWVEQPSGDPYGRLAGQLEPVARRLYAAWWDADEVVATAPDAPEWATDADRFWAARHRLEIDEKDPLPEHSVYPFYVLGDPQGRLRVTASSAGRLDASTIRQSMSEPWLPDGWRQWQNGNRKPGYGYWGEERPGWEPRTYPAVAAALELLDAPAFHLGSVASTSALGQGRSYPAASGSTVAGGLGGALARIVATLSPAAGSAFDWRGEVPMRYTVQTVDDDELQVVGNSKRSGIEGKPAVDCRAWRSAAYDREDRRMLRDEIQLLVTGEDPTRLKLWIKIGYRDSDQGQGLLLDRDGPRLDSVPNVTPPTRK